MKILWQFNKFYACGYFLHWVVRGSLSAAGISSLTQFCLTWRETEWMSLWTTEKISSPSWRSASPPPLSVSLSLSLLFSIPSPQAFGQSFLQKDISLFKQNLSALETLNKKHKLYSKVSSDILSLTLFLHLTKPCNISKNQNLLNPTKMLQINFFIHVFSIVSEICIPEMFLFSSAVIQEPHVASSAASVG